MDRDETLMKRLQHTEVIITMNKTDPGTKSYTNNGVSLIGHYTLRTWQTLTWSDPDFLNDLALALVAALQTTTLPNNPPQPTGSKCAAPKPVKRKTKPLMLGPDHDIG